MRKWHRWLSLIFGIFMLWIAATGVLSQIVPLTQSRPEGDKSAPVVLSKLQPGFVCPADVTCRPRKQGGGNIVGLLHHLHSGESFGPLGVLISTLSGFALLFFAASGLWLYIQMWNHRKSRALAPRWFWK
ncbi:MAG: PepSY domain-containing protein [Sphingomonadales bacterium]|nr:PepSY domain-containing protein [Sphingomonadales bacterium]MDE2171948.1 PepSY domain-containing protein [Sphingomonadales bacterium]